MNRCNLAMAAGLALAGAAAALSAAGQDAARSPMAPSWGAASQLHGYLGRHTLNGAEIVGPPPSPDSPEGRADQQTFDASRALAGSPRWQAAVQDNDLWRGGALKRLSCAIGRDISAAATPRTAMMLARVERDASVVGTPAKELYDRKRPALGNDKPICVPRGAWLASNASYPSGHAMVGWAWGLILAEADPARASQALEAGREIGWSRVICGVHYPSDVTAGRELGAAMVAELHDEPAFQEDLADAKRELSTAPAPAGCGSP